MDHRKRSVRSWHKAPNLSHDIHEGNRPNVSALATHVAAGNNLESLLLTCIYIIWYELLLVNLKLGQLWRLA
jgi:hypothetical protein